MKTTTCTAIAALLLIGQAASGGPLTPPGAPASTMKTLDEVEARTPIRATDIPLNISQPGSYYLTENINHTGISNGISITASNVTLDLNGFTLNGSGAGGSAVGILATTDFTTGTVIKNGTVENWPEEGVQLLSPGSHVENIKVLKNGADGISILTGSIINCTAAFNAESGIVTTGDSIPIQSTISSCTTANNGGDGIEILSASIVEGNTNSANSRNGISFHSDALGSVAENNACTDNAHAGIRLLAPNSTVTNNNCSRNSKDGIFIIVAPNSTINSNNCSGNGLAGIKVLDSPSSTVNGNHCSVNLIDGISLRIDSPECTVKDNHCSGNNDIGIRIASPGCSIESNKVSNNTGTGLLVSNSSIALKNISMGNGTDYSFTSGARHGPVTPLPVSGAIASTNPWANFSF